MFATVEFLILITGAVLAIIVWYLQSAKRRAILAKIPGPEPLPIIGNAHQLETDGAAFYKQILTYCEEYRHQGPIFKLLLGTKPMIVCHHPESAEFVLSSNQHITKSTDYRFLHPWLGTGLLTSSGQKWHNRRRLLTPTFHFRILIDFLRVFNEQAEVMTSRLEKKCGEGTFDMFPYITLCALDIISETAMGKSINAQSGGSNAAYVDAIYKISELVQRRQKQPWLWPDFIYYRLPAGKVFNKYLDILQGFTNKVIGERMTEIKDQPLEEEVSAEADDAGVGTSKRKLAFLDLLLHMAQEAGFTQEDIREEVDTFMFEGHDTTAAAANWAVHLIGANPDVQQRLHEEMDAVFGDTDRAVTMDDLRDMKYLECVIKETLRIFPSVPIFGRQLLEDTEICGHQVPKGASIIVMTPAVHRDQKIFPDPEHFDPERFTKDNCAGRHPYSFIPFSAGPRNCIGQRFAMNEEKVILSSILRKFNIESMQKREDLHPVGELILRPEKGVHVKLTKRVK